MNETNETNGTADKCYVWGIAAVNTDKAGITTAWTAVRYITGASGYKTAADLGKSNIRATTRSRAIVLAVECCGACDKVTQVVRDDYAYSLKVVREDEAARTKKVLDKATTAHDIAVAMYERSDDDAAVRLAEIAE